MAARLEGVLLDTNVLIDYALGREPQGGVCAELLEELVRGDKTVYVAAVSLKDLFYVVENYITRQARADHGGVLLPGDAAAATRIAWSCVERMLDIALVPNLGYAECREACMLRGVHGDFEDDLVVAAALHLGADCLVTSDERLMRHAPIACLAPQDALVLLRRGGCPWRCGRFLTCAAARAI